MLSIITPTMNSGKYIETCIDGIRKQDIDMKIEHIIMDNMSSDNTDDVINSFPEMKNREIIHIREKDDGHHDAISKGISMAKGNYIGVCNSSDFYSYEKWFKEAIDGIKLNNVHCAYASTSIVDEDSLLFVKNFGCLSVRQMFKMNWESYLDNGIGFNECSGIFKAEAIKSLMPMTKLEHPWLDVQFRFYEAGFSSIFLLIPVATTRLHHDSLANQNGKEIEIKAFKKLHDKIENAILQNKE